MAIISGQRALVVGQTVSLRDALVALLTGLPGMAAVEPAAGAEPAIAILRERPAALVLLDATSYEADEAPDVLRIIQSAAPQTRFAVLVDEAQEWIATASVDAVLWLGAPAAELRACIGGLLAEEPVRWSIDRT